MFELVGDGVALDYFTVAADSGVITLTQSLKNDTLQLDTYTVTFLINRSCGRFS